MTVVGQIEYIASINTKDYDSGVKKIEGANKSIADSAEKSTKRMDLTWRNSDKAFGSLVKSMAAGALVVGAAVGAIAVQGIKSAAALEQSMGGAEAVFGSFGSVVQETARNSAAVMGTSANQYLETANKMGSLFQGAGFSVKESMELSGSAMQRATDVATAMGISTESALESIAGAAKGNFTMMDNLGVAMNDTTLNAYALEKGIGKTTQQMTNSEKVGLAMQLFMEKTSKYAGNYAKENQTLSGSMSTLSASWGNFISGVEGSDKQLADAIGNVLNVFGEQIPIVLGRLTGLVQNMITSFLEANPAVATALEIFKQVAIAVGILLIPQLIRYIALQTMAGVQALIAGAKIAAGWLMALGPIGLIIAAVAAAAALIIMNWDSIKEAFIVAWDLIKSAFSAAIEFIKSVWGTIVDFFKGIFNAIKTAIEWYVNIYVSLFKAAWDGIKAIWSAVTGWFKGVWDGIVRVFSVVGSWFGNVFQGAWNAIKNVFSAVGGFFQGVWNTIKSIFTTIGSTIGSAIGGAFKTVVNSIIGFAENTINGFIRAINGAIGMINKIPGVSISTIGEMAVPRLAKGGITTGSTLANIGEAGREVVLPLENNTEWMDDLADKIGGGGPTTVIVKLGEETIATRVIDLINDRTRLSGNNSIMV